MTRFVVVRDGLHHPIAFGVLPADYCARIAYVTAVEFVVQHIAADDSRAGVRQIDLRFLREFFHRRLVGSVEAVTGVLLETGHAANGLSQMTLNEARDMMPVITVPITDPKEVLPALLANIGRHDIRILVEFLRVRNKALLASVGVAHDVLEVTVLRFARGLTHLKFVDRS